MTIDPKVHAIATMVVDQLLDEIDPPSECGCCFSVDRNAYIARIGKRMQGALEDECAAIRKEIESAGPL